MSFSSTAGQGLRLERGRPVPLGPSVTPTGVNFAVVSTRSERLELLLFAPGGRSPAVSWTLDPEVHRTGDVWHAEVIGLRPGFQYGFRSPAGEETAPGPLLLDPYVRSVAGSERWGEGERMRPRRGRLVQPSAPPSVPGPRRPWGDTVIYELHVRGFTRHESSGAGEAAGTFAGLETKIPYLRELGVTAVELLPIAEFEENDNPRRNPENGERLKNFWGYQPLALFAPRTAYAASREPGGEIGELRRTVEAFHRAGIEVFLDVVFNHTGEGPSVEEDGGWTLSLRGLAEEIYYLRDPRSGLPLDLTGCGNTLRTHHPVVRRLIVDCLRYWTSELGIDGFRFDLASVLGRGMDGEPLPEPPLLEEIAADPSLADVKLIAEPWDLGGLYQVGSFPGFGRFSEWNGRFRDDVRRFVRGDRSTAGTLIQRLLGSPDLYAGPRRSVLQSINYVTCHDGFTLADLVSYDRKHNLSNGEENRDGLDENFSWNCGVEGPTRDPGILALRRKQQKNLLALLLLSRGVPTLLGGDEMGRSQSGNNNAYCHDSEISWLDWRLLDENRELVRFVRQLLALRRRHRHTRDAELLPETFEQPAGGAAPAVALPEEAPLAILHLRAVGEDDLLVLCNATAEAVPIQVGSPSAGGWRRAIDTSRPSPEDIAEPGREAAVSTADPLPVESRSVMVLVGGGR